MPLKQLVTHACKRRASQPNRNEHRKDLVAEHSHSYLFFHYGLICGSSFTVRLVPVDSCTAY